MQIAKILQEQIQNQGFGGRPGQFLGPNTMVNSNKGVERIRLFGNRGIPQGFATRMIPKSIRELARMTVMAQSAVECLQMYNSSQSR